MARSKVKLAFIQNPSARRATYRKRIKGLKKLVSELSTLCDVESCAIIYGALSPEPEVWPSPVGVHEVLTRFKGLSEYQQHMKMENQVSITRGNIKKSEESLKKLQIENRYKEVSLFMIRLLIDDPTSENRVLDLLDMGSVAKEVVMEISQRTKEWMLKNQQRGLVNLTLGLEMANGYEHANHKADKEARDRGHTSSGSGVVLGSTTNSFAYSSQMPPFMIKFISSVLDVESDGNCGFRVIADFMYNDQELWDQVRYELMQELIENYNFYMGSIGSEFFQEGYFISNWHRSPAPNRHWLALGSLGYVISTRYQRIVTCYCGQPLGCNTFLPLQARSSDTLPPVEQINLGLVNDNHFISLRLKTSSPMPRMCLYPVWENICDPSILHWSQVLTDRLNSYVTLDTS